MYVYVPSDIQIIKGTICITNILNSFENRHLAASVSLIIKHTAQLGVQPKYIYALRDLNISFTCDPRHTDALVDLRSRGFWFGGSSLLCFPCCDVAFIYQYKHRYFIFRQ